MRKPVCYNGDMKTQKIRIRNLSEARIRQGVSVHVKPLPVLTTLLAIGAIMIIISPNLIVTGLALILASIFMITILPDRVLITFLDDCMVLYNQQDRSMCMLIYYDEVVNWQYVYHAKYDEIIFTLVDGSTEVQEMYSLYSVAASLDEHLKGKQLKSLRIRKEQS